VVSRYGGISLIADSTATSLNVNGSVTANGGPVVIENDNKTSGTIVFGNNVLVSGFGRVFDYQGTSPAVAYLTGVAVLSGGFPATPSQSVIPPGVTLFINGTQQSPGTPPSTAPTAFFGAPGLVASGATVNVTSGAAYPSAVVFNGPGTITLNAGTTITSQGTVQSLSRLDLNNATVTSGLTNLTNNVPDAGVTYSATSKTLALATNVSLINLRSLYIPAGFSVTIANAGTPNPVAVNIPLNSQATVNGALQISSSPANPPVSLGQISINSISTTTDNVLTMASTAKIASDNDLILDIGGKASLAGTISAGSGGSLSISTGITNTGTGTTNPPGSLAITAVVSAGTVSGSGAIAIDASGSINQTAGSITAGDISLEIGGNNGSRPASRISLIKVNTGQLTVSTGSGSGNVQITEGSGFAVGSLILNIQRNDLKFSQSQQLSLSGIGLGQVSVTTTGTAPLTIIGNLSCGSCSFTTSSFNTNNATISVSNPANALSIVSSGSINLNNTMIALAGGTLSLQAQQAVSITDSTLQSGTFSANSVFGGGLLLPTDVAAKGNISISSSKSNITIGGATILNTVGGDIQLTSTLGNISMQGQFEADGGNVKVLAKGNITGSAPVITANAIGTMATNSKGGGIELTAGSTTSKLSAAFGQAPGSVNAVPTFLQPDGSVQVLGRATTLNNTFGINLGSGSIQQTGTASAVDLSTTAGASVAPLQTIPPGPGDSAAVLNLSGGAMVFNTGGTAFVKFDGCALTVNGYLPISYMVGMPLAATTSGSANSTESIEELVVDSGEDANPNDCQLR
jgi:hypothetical protein